VSTSGAFATGVVTTETSWEGDLQYGISTSGGIGSLCVEVISKVAPQGSIRQWFDVVE
jgi:hypothetical protein